MSKCKIGKREVMVVYILYFISVGMRGTRKRRSYGSIYSEVMEPLGQLFFTHPNGNGVLLDLQ